MSRIGKPITILYADDDAEDRMLVKDAWAENRLANELHFVEDGEELMDYLRRRGKYANLADLPLPGMILLDLNMPRKAGHECLDEIKGNEHLRSIAVIIYSTSLNPEVVDLLYQKGAHRYVRKPGEFSKLKEAIFEAITSVINGTKPTKENFVIKV